MKSRGTADVQVKQKRLKNKEEKISKWLRDELQTTTEVQIKIKKGSDKLLTDSFEGSLGSCTILESSRGLRTFSVSNSGFTKSPFLDRNTHRRHNNKRAVSSLFSTQTSFFFWGGAQFSRVDAKKSA